MEGNTESLLMSTYYVSYNILGDGNVAMHKILWIFGTDIKNNERESKFSTILEKFLTLS